LGILYRSEIMTEQHTPNPDVPYTIPTMTGFARYSLMKSFVICHEGR